MSVFRLLAVWGMLLFALSLTACGGSDSSPAPSSDGDTQEQETDSLDTDHETSVVDGDATEDDGETSAVDGDTTESDGETSAVDGDTTESDGETSAVDGDTTESDGETSAVDGDTTENEEDKLTVPDVPAGFSLLNIAAGLCPRATACGLVSNVAECFDGLAGDRLDEQSMIVFARDQERLNCAARAGKCSEFKACWQGMTPDTKNECAAFAEDVLDDQASGCLGNVFIECRRFSDVNAGWYSIKTDCAIKGFVCAKDSEDEAKCRSTSQTCGSIGGEQGCEGNAILFCPEYADSTDKPEYWADCADYNGICGNRCEDTPSGQPCYFTNPNGCRPKTLIPCSEDLCRDEIAAPCQGGHLNIAMTCKAVAPDFVCYPQNLAGDNELNCQLPADKRECTPGESPTLTCQGTKASFCVAGKKLEMDCATVNGSCSEGTQGCEISEDAYSE